MASNEVILAVDQGSSATKALLVSGDGIAVASASAPVTSTFPHPGWVEQAPQEIWHSVRFAVAACLSGRPSARVSAVALTNQRESMLLWDRHNGEPLSPLISWQDQRTAAICAALLDAGHGPMVREHTGLPLDPMFSATRAKWLLDHVDPRRHRARGGGLCLGTVDAWLLSRLGGEPVIEVGNASRTQLLNLHTRQWDTALLDLFDIPEAALPRVVSSIGPFPAANGLAPVPDGTPVTAVLADSHAALFAHAGWMPGRVKATYGTGSSVMGLCPSATKVDEALCLTVAWDDGEPSYAVEGNIRSSGATLGWLGRCVGRSPAELAALAADASSDGVHIVPAFNGLGAPWWDADATGLVSGLTMSSGLPQLARAALESIAFQVDDVVEATENTMGAVSTLLADGGPSGNPTLMQLQADLSGRLVHRSGQENLSALGAAHLAGHVIGLWSRTDLDGLTRPYEVFTPDLPVEARRALRSGWHAAVDRARMPAGPAPGEHHE
jgi:glycerol kinase